MTDPYEDGTSPELADAPTAPTIASFTLYRVDTRGRVNLVGLLAPGVEFYTGQKNADGTILLSPVRVETTALKRPGASKADDDA